MNPAAAPSNASAARNTPLQLPAPVGRALSLLPPYPGSVLFVAALNRLVTPNLPADVRQHLQGRRLRIAVTDARVAFDFSCRDGRMVALPRQGSTDLTISASAQDFLRMAQRQDDPDTLFFNRRLSMEGDTELGLVVKNTLDALELPVLDLREWLPHRVLQRLEARRNGHGH